MKIYRLKACGKCGGDLARDSDDWICLQCGSYFYIGLYSGAEPRMDPLSELVLEWDHLESNPKPHHQGEGSEKSVGGPVTVPVTVPDPSPSTCPTIGGSIRLLTLQTCQGMPW